MEITRFVISYDQLSYDQLSYDQLLYDQLKLKIVILDVISSNNEYATTYTPVRRGSNGKLEYQFSLGANHIKFSTQSRITGEGMLKSF